MHMDFCAMILCVINVNFNVNFDVNFNHFKYTKVLHKGSTKVLGADE